MKKILFSDKFGLTEAVLSGRKRQTRRIVPRNFFTCTHDILDNNTIEFEDMYGDWHDILKSAYAFKVGEIVAVAQSYKDCTEECIKTTGLEVTTKPHLAKVPGYKNKMFVRADLMPHHIRITDVRVEPLRSISANDCIAEGVVKGRVGSEDTHFMDAYYPPTMMRLPCCTPHEAYAILIDRISGKGTWDKNPYVFVYNFELAD